MTSIFIIGLGLIVGSFLNVVALRLNTGESFARSRSRCYSCGSLLTWRDMIPVLSFIILKGRCRVCKSKISLQYPLVEILTATVFYCSYLKWTRGYVVDIAHAGILFWWMIFWSLFIVLIIYDLRHKIIPDSISYSMVLTAILGVLIFREESLWESIMSGIILFLFFWLLWEISRGKWMGLGDAKLFLSVGIFFGWPLGLIALFFSFWTGAIISSALLMTQKSLTLKSEIPFAPFVFLGAIIAFFWGDMLYTWYQMLII